MKRAVLASVCALCFGTQAAAQTMTGANHVLRGAHVSAGFALAVNGGQSVRVSLGESDPPGFGASLAGSHGGAFGFLATLVGGFGPADADGDGVPTLADNCPFAADPAQLDFDGDGLGDACDSDDDDDLLTDAEEQEVGSNSFAADTDGDGLSDFTEVIALGSSPLTSDTDGDGRLDATDNCIAVANNQIPGSLDADLDGIGDACDPDAQGKRFWAFESGPVRPLAVTPDGSRLLATNVPDGRLEIFSITPTGLTPLASVPVGLEPVAVSARSDTEAWVVNHLSDSVSIVSLTDPPQVVQTLLVGDEPRDVVFAGPGGSRAFLTTAHRGQNSPFPLADYDVPGVGRADVWVFDANAPGTALGGAPLTIVTLFGDKPRALAASADGSRVYAAVMNSGNRTATVAETAVCDGFGSAPCLVEGHSYPGGLPSPFDNHEGVAAPEVGLVVKFDAQSGEWRDELGRDWSEGVRFDLPDLDVFELDANASPPVELNAFAGVGTTIFGLVANPVTGAVYAANTDARNEVRFEGHGVYAGPFKPPGVPASVRGHLHEARITVIEGGVVTPRHLNKHIPYGVTPVPAGVKDASLATPVGLAISPDGATLYVAAFGSSKIGVFDTGQLASDSFVPSSASHFPVAGGGPAGLALAGGRLYTLTRFSNEVVALDAASGAELDRRALHDPEPAIVRDGRPFLYDAVTTSSNGEASCSSCHVFADLDDLAWDLGDPDGDVESNANAIVPILPASPFHPNKGPMTTQTLRGMARNGPMHWRGDRTGPACASINLECARQAFVAFNVAFDGLLGRDQGPLPSQDMEAFRDFILEVTQPPNPVRQLDNSLRNPVDPSAANETRGSLRYNAPGSDGGLACQACHTFSPSNSFFGTAGLTSFEGEPQFFKVPHLRNAYQKIGMFGMPDLPTLAGTHAHTGPQVRSTGFLHDGVIDTLESFLRSTAFTLTAQDRKDLEAFILAFDSDLAPIVGQQVTLGPASGADSLARASLLTARSQVSFVRAGLPMARECDLVVTGVLDGESRGWLQGSGQFRSDGTEAPLTLAALQDIALLEGVPLTLTCAPPGSGPRIALDRDEDGVANFAEVLLGSDPESSDSDGDGTPDGAEDADGDRIVDVRDNCLFADNVSQHDPGGVGPGSAADGIGSACQCGDLSGDGIVLDADVDLLRAHLADPVGTPLPGGALERCRVTLGSLGCDIVQVTVLERALAGEPAARLDPVCDVALP